METLELHNTELQITLQAHEEKHLLLLNPSNAILRIKQEADSKLIIHSITLPGAEDATNEVQVEQVGKGCETQLYGMALLTGQQQLHLTTRVQHSVGGGKSEQLFKFALQDDARGSFYGELKVMPDAQQTEARQTNRNILLSPTAKMQTRPQLEIYADDVQCSHGATTGQLDTQALFYMQQRGITQSEARRMLLVAFLSDALRGLPEETQQNMLQQIENVWNIK